MKTTLLLSLLTLALSVQTLAQDSPKTVERTIEIEDGKSPKVTITTTEDGKTTVKELEGEAARDYIEERDKEHSNSNNGRTRTIVEIDIDEDDIDEMKETMRKVKVDVEREIERMSDEIKHMNVDSVMESVGVEIERTLDEVRYQYDTDGNQRTSVIVIRSGNSDQDDEIDIEVEVRSNGDDEEREVTVTRSKMVVEDTDDPQDELTHVKDLKVYPVPSKGALNIEFENKEKGIVHIKLKDMQGKTVREMKIKGDGKKHMKMNLDDLAAGTYIIEVKEGGATVAKRLILE